MPEHALPPSPKETARLVDDLQCLLTKLSVDAETLRPLHHLHDSLSGFQEYCKGIKNFRPNGNNHRMHLRLQFIYEKLRCATHVKEISLTALIEEAKLKYPPVERQKNGRSR